jgi:amino acid adenylation domain-containing protein
MLADELERVVRLYPEAVAIDDFSRGKITYLQMWSLVYQAACHMDEWLGDNQYVGIIADQDGYAVIALIATIISGRTIVPIDPRLSTESIEETLKPFSLKAILGRGNENLRKMTNLDLLDLDKLVHKRVINHTVKTYTQDSFAYILHTSGTTGKPKAVLAKQSSLMHIAQVLANQYHIDKESRVLQFAYFSFDSAFVEIWSTLLQGGTIIVPGVELRENMYGCLKKILCSNKITITTLPPSVALNCDIDDLAKLDTLILAGEECPARFTNSLYGKVKHLINAYGPTESIICATTYEIYSLHDARVPIGRPLPGMKIILLDLLNMQESKTGEGEICLVSDYLAEGYPNDVEMTNKKFKSYDHLSNKRYYITGDYGKIVNDGNYEFIGRVDNQVKINGQRVELESIETEIQRITNIPRVVAVYLKDDDIRGLYCVYPSDSMGINNLSINAVKDKLKNKLPPYMLPQNYVSIDELPLDLNGKTDRSIVRIYLINYLRNEKHNECQCYQNTYEEAMIHLWADSLNTAANTISIDSDFFDLGGDSLAALKLVANINKEFGVELRLSSILREPVTPRNMIETVHQYQVRE